MLHINDYVGLPVGAFSAHGSTQTSRFHIAEAPQQVGAMIGGSFSIKFNWKYSRTCGNAVGVDQQFENIGSNSV